MIAVPATRVMRLDKKPLWAIRKRALLTLDGSLDPGGIFAHLSDALLGNWIYAAARLGFDQSCASLLSVVEASGGFTWGSIEGRVMQ